MSGARKTLWCSVMTVIFYLVWRPMLVAALAANAQPGFAQSAFEFHRTLSVTASAPVTLDVQLTECELQIAYGRNEQVTISASAKDPSGEKAGGRLATAFAIEQDGNHLRIRHLSPGGPTERRKRVVCKIDVPYLTEVRSVVDNGKQTITGIMGPVSARTRNGDIKVSYVSRGVRAEAGSGNLDIEVIGERVEARTGDGNISCIRAAQGANAETGSGDIVLMVVGPSNASVKKGTGRIEVGGARGSFIGSTTEGDLNVKALPHDDWRLSSDSGAIRVEIPPAARFEVDATTNVGEVLINRDDIEWPKAELRHLNQKVNGGGKRIEMHTNSGKIVIR